MSDARRLGEHEDGAVEGAEGAGTPWVGWFKDGLLQAGYDGERTKAGFVAWAKAHKEEL